MILAMARPLLTQRSISKLMRKITPGRNWHQHPIALFWSSILPASMTPVKTMPFRSISAGKFSKGDMVTRRE
jgi:hypothetical protein